MFAGLYNSRKYRNCIKSNRNVKYIITLLCSFVCEDGGVFQLSAERRVDIKDAQFELVAFRILLHVDWLSIKGDIGRDSSQIRKVNMT